MADDYGIPRGTYWRKPSLPAGTVATTESPTINSLIVGDATLAYGIATNINANGEAVLTEAAPIYGISVKRNYTDSTSLSDVTGDHWDKGDTSGIMRDGTIYVALANDVKNGDFATVTTGGKFKTAGASDKIVGQFTSDGKQGDTAELQVRVQFLRPDSSTPTPSA